MPFAYLVALELHGRRCVVVGGGPMAEHKVGGLLAAGARVSVVAEHFTPGLDALGAGGDVELVRRRWHPGDLDGAFLAVAADSDRVDNAELFRVAEERRVLFNAVDDPDHCHFAVPAIVRRGDVVVAVSTGGKAPAVAKRLREELASQLGPEWGTLVELLAEVRAETGAGSDIDLDLDTKAERWQRALGQDLAGLVRAGRTEEAKDVVRRCLSDPG